MTSRDIPAEPDLDPPLRELPINFLNLPRWAALLPIRLYQLTLSRLVPSDTCRFTPTCSHYAFQAIYKHGLIRGGGLAVYRLVRCQPFCAGGYDPVP
jgi:putative membrane protein insertion efficiency factor